MKWKYVKPTNAARINEVEKILGFEVPKDLKDLIMQANNGRPEFDCFDTETETGKQFKKLLSYNKEDMENIFSYIDLFKDLQLIPFADDPAGSFLCLDNNNNNEVIYWDHESGEKIFVANSLTAFLSSLYE